MPSREPDTPPSGPDPLGEDVVTERAEPSWPAHSGSLGPVSPGPAQEAATVAPGSMLGSALPGLRGAVRKQLRGHPVMRFTARRVGAGIILLFVASMLVFVGTEVLPGDAANAVLGRNATPEALAAIRTELELDRPVVARYFDWLGGFLAGDLGESLNARRPVSDLIGERIRNTLILAIAAALVIFPLSVLAGVIAGTRPGRAADHTISGVALTFIAMPEFVLGTFLIVIFALNLDLVPPVSLVTTSSTPLDDPSILVLPVLTLLLVGMAYMIRMVRAGMLDVMSSDYIEMARLHGIPELRIIRRHALRNALAPTVQVAILTLQWLVGGLIIVEELFGYPGIGQALVQGVAARDIPFVQSVAMLIAIVYVALTIVADLLVVLLIPKLRTA